LEHTTGDENAALQTIADETARKSEALKCRRSEALRFPVWMLRKD
jgi:hypothetical protein